MSTRLSHSLLRLAICQALKSPPPRWTQGLLAAGLMTLTSPTLGIEPNEIATEQNRFAISQMDTSQSDFWLTNPRQRQREDETVILHTTPIPANLTEGSSFDITVQVDANTIPIGTAAAYLNFNPDMLQGNDLIPGDKFDLIWNSSIDNKKGYINFVALAWKNEEPTGNFPLVTLNFTVLKLGGEKTLVFKTIGLRQIKVFSDSGAPLIPTGTIVCEDIMPDKENPDVSVPTTNHINSDILASPIAPTNLIAKPVENSQNQIELLWTDNSHNETHFVIGRSTTSVSGYTDIPVSTTNHNSCIGFSQVYVDNSSTCGMTYYYVVRSQIDSLYNSANTSEVSATTPRCSTTLTINPAKFNTLNQSVTLTAFVDSKGVIVNTGTVTFTVKQDETIIGQLMTSRVINGHASVDYILPVNKLTDSYIIKASYSGGERFSESSGRKTATIRMGPSIELNDIARGIGGFVINGINIGDKLGSSVSSAGDINGDGLNDLLIGAPDANHSTGATYVVFGKLDTKAVNLNEVVNGVGGFVINGIEEGDKAGFSVSGAVDINGDGLDDVIIGAPEAGPRYACNNKYGKGGDYICKSELGESYVVFGKNNTDAINLSEITNGVEGFIIVGIDNGDQLGRSVSGAGDVNSDGLHDLIIGAPGARRSYVIFGKPEMDAVNLNQITNGIGGFIIDSEKSSYLHSVSGAFDVNNDGLDDLIIAYRSNSYVIFGKNNTKAINLNDITEGVGGFVIDGANSSVSNAGDINGDGLDDIIIGYYETNVNESYVVFGKNDTAAVNLSEVSNNLGGFIINGINGGDKSGYSVSSAGDFNNDGLDDLIIGAPNALYRENQAGQSYVVFGKNDTTAVNLSKVTYGIGGLVINGIDKRDESGFSVSDAGDVNGDGLNDLIIGAPKANKSYVVFALPYAIMAPTNLTTTSISQTQIDLQWTDNSDNETHFFIGRFNDTFDSGYIEMPVVTNHQAGIDSSQTYNDTGLVCGTTYDYVVRAVINATHKSNNSSEMSATTFGCSTTVTIPHTEAKLTARPNTLNQTTKLTAYVSSDVDIVNVGTITFTVKQGKTTIGSPMISTVTEGVASVNYILPGDANLTGTYTVEAVYSEGQRFANNHNTGTLAIEVIPSKGIHFLDVIQPTDNGKGDRVGSLSWAILQANQLPGDDTITLHSDVTIQEIMKTLFNSNIEVIGNHHTISGNNQFRPIFVKDGKVKLANLTLTEGQSKGIEGGGAGLGGALFIYGGSVIIDRVIFNQNQAIGGWGHGGKLGGTDISGYVFSDNFSTNDSINGGFGEGGSGDDYGYYGGSGGFGGSGSGGFYTTGSNGYGASINYGAGFGGAIFMKSGLLTVKNSTFNNNSASGGEPPLGGESSNHASGKGGALFICKHGTGSGEIDHPTASSCDAHISSDSCGVIFGNGENANTASTSHADYFGNLGNMISACPPDIEVEGNRVTLDDRDISFHNQEDYIDFGIIKKGDYVTRTFTLNNTGYLPLKLTDTPKIKVIGSGFAVTRQPTSPIAVQESTTFEVTFQPTNSGIVQGIIRIDNDNPDNKPYTFSIRGMVPNGFLNTFSNSHQQIITDVLEVGNRASLSNIILEGALLNHGLVSNLTIKSQGYLSGGTISGYIKNEGTMIDFEFRGASIIGGMLAGEIINSSEVGGYFQDVHLAANTHITGGKLAGRIEGEASAPALLESLIIKPGSHLSDVIIGDNVELPDDVILEQSVTFTNPKTRQRDFEKTELQLDCIVNGLEINAQGQQGDSQTCFTSKIETRDGVQLNPITLTSTEAQELRIEAMLTLAPAHVGKPAELLIMGVYQTADSQNAYLRVGEDWLPWDGEIGYLQPAELYSQLPNHLEIQLFEGDLSALSGEFTVFVGYRLEDGTIVYNGSKPIRFWVDG
jgi:hypothetical protein